MIKKISTCILLDTYIWGRELDDVEEIIAELKNRNIDLELVRKDVDNIIQKYC